jgi:PAS domain S-box-containing protein
MKSPILNASKADLFDSAPVIISFQDLDHNIVWANRAYQEATGLSLQEIEGKKCYSIWELSKPCLNCPVTKVIETGEPDEAELTLQNQEHRPDTQVSWLLRASPIRDEDGSVIGAVETAFDITERKRAEEALENRAHQQAEVAKFGQLALSGMSLDELFQQAVALISQVLGTKYAKVLEHLPEQQVLFLRAGVGWKEGWVGHKSVPDGPGSQGGYTLLRYKPVIAEDIRNETRFSPPALLTEHNVVGGMTVAIPGTDRPFGVLGVHTDRMQRFSADDAHFLEAVANVLAAALQRTRAEETLATERRRLSDILKGTNVGTWEWNVQTGETIFNERWAEIIGYTLEEISPVSIDTWMKFCHPDDLKVSRELLERNFNGELDYYECEARRRHKNGNWVWVLDRGKVATWTEDGKPLLMSGTHQDITIRKQAEEEREKLQAQFVQAQKMESVGRLAGGVAHDFNNMLSVILGHAELALMKADPAQPLHADLVEIQKAAQRSADLTRQLLAFARKQIVAPRILELNDTVAGMLKMLQRLIGEDIDLAWLPGAKLWPVKMDSSQIDQVLANLCVNARDAIDGVGKVTIETDNIAFDEAYCADHAGFVSGEYVMLAVSDDGRGMEKEVLEHLFEPFFTTKGVGEGTGLGLATVYGIVKQNQGFINVYSEPGTETTFRIYLPRHVGKAAQARLEGPAEPVSSGQETVLLVEDESAILNMGRKMLEKLGYLVVTAGTPGEAIRLAEEHAGEIHLLRTDVVMPEMNGRDLARRLLSLYPDLKRLFMSGYTANVIAHRGVLEEGVHFIQKPFSMKDLGFKVREALERNE